VERRERGGGEGREGKEKLLILGSAKENRQRHISHLLLYIGQTFFHLFFLYHTAFKLFSLWHVGYLSDDFYNF
jgi:hypothetical protein